MRCPRRWFLEREAGGVARAHQSANLGEMVHALAQRVASGELAAGRDDVDQLMTHVDAVWDRLDFRTPRWARSYERVRAAGPVPRVASRQPPHAGGDGGEVLHRRPAARRRGGQPHRYADRTEVGADGSWWSTSRPAAAPRATRPSRRTSSWASTSTPWTTAPSTTAFPTPRRPGRRARQLGLLDGGPAAVVQTQPVQAEDGPAREGLPASSPAPPGCSARSRSRGRRRHCRTARSCPSARSERRTGDLPVIAIRTPRTCRRS